MNKPTGPIAADYGSQEAAMRAYCQDGEARAYALGNRGPIRFTEGGKLHPDILAGLLALRLLCLRGRAGRGGAGRYRKPTS